MIWMRAALIIGLIAGLVFGAVQNAFAARSETERTDVAEKYRINPHWRCFFCDEVFTTRGLAAEHFGTEVGCDYPLPACQIKAHEGHLVTYIRKLEEELNVWNREAHQIQQAILTLEGEVAQQVRDAEEKGYARGVADMKTQGFCVEPSKH